MKIEQQYIQTVNALVWERIRKSLNELTKDQRVETAPPMWLAGNDEAIMDERIRSYEKELKGIIDSAGRNGVFLPFEYLFTRYQCNDFERHVIWLLTAADMDQRLIQASGIIHGNLGIRCITPYLAQAVFAEPLSDYEVYQAFSEESTLGNGILEMKDNGLGELLKQAVLRPRIKSFLYDGTIEYEPWQTYLKYSTPMEELDEICGSGELVDRLVQMCSALPEEGSLVIRLTGQEGAGKRFTVRHLSKRMGWPCIYLSLDDMDWESRYAQVESFIFECRLLMAVPVVCREKELHYEAEPFGNLMKFLWNRLCREFPLVFVTADEMIYKADETPGIRFINLLIPEPTLLEGKLMWEQKSRSFPLDKAVIPGEMANKFRLTPGKIQKALEEASGYRLYEGESVITQELLNRGCSNILKQHRNSRTTKVESRYTWNQLILPRAQMELLKTACNQVRHKHLVYGAWGMDANMAYGRGISMIFSGSPGTGKTMAAQVLAGEIGLELYKVELAAVVSKYIGETEKNLDDIFEQAKRGQFILFFDEADVLFGKRTEIKDSNDKYSNMEAAFMLQKMEEYEGITILATNYLQNFDEAFKRRVKFMIDFPFPDPESRKLIWKKAFPEQMPVGELDFEYLSHFSLSGSNIKNVVIHSAFLAAANGKAVGMEEILMGIRNEFAKNGKALTREDLGEYYLLLQ